jgi:hypothetical protein
MGSAPGGRGQGVSSVAAAAVRAGHGPFGVEDPEQPVVEFVRAADQLARRAGERLGGPLVGRLRHRQDVADLVHQQADRPVVGLDHHVDRQPVGRPVG